VGEITVLTFSLSSISNFAFCNVEGFKIEFKAFSLSHQLGFEIAIQEHPTLMTHRMLHYHINYCLYHYVCCIYCWVWL